MKLLYKVGILISICSITGCTTIGQQIINRDGTIQIKQENVQFNASNGGTNTAPSTEQINEQVYEYVTPTTVVVPPPVVYEVPPPVKYIYKPGNQEYYQKYLKTPQERILTYPDQVQETINETTTNINVYTDSVTVNAY